MGTPFDQAMEAGVTRGQGPRLFEWIEDPATGLNIPICLKPHYRAFAQHYEPTAVKRIGVPLNRLLAAVERNEGGAFDRYRYLKDYTGLTGTAVYAPKHAQLSQALVRRELEVPKLTPRFIDLTAEFLGKFSVALAEQGIEQEA